MFNSENFVATAAINADGQVTLPQSVRNLLEIKEDEILKFTVIDGKISLAKNTVNVVNKEAEAVFVPSDDDLVLLGRCMGQCTIC